MWVKTRLLRNSQEWEHTGKLLRWLRLCRASLTYFFSAKCMFSILMLGSLVTSGGGGLFCYRLIFINAQPFWMHIVDMAWVGLKILDLGLRQSLRRLISCRSCIWSHSYCKFMIVAVLWSADNTCFSAFLLYFYVSLSFQLLFLGGPQLWREGMT